MNAGAVVRTHGDSRAEGHLELFTGVTLERERAEVAQQIERRGVGDDPYRAGEREEELFTAPSAPQVSRPRASFEETTHRRENTIARVVTVDVVYGLEQIEIEQGDGERLPMPMAFEQHARESLERRSP